MSLLAFFLLLALLSSVTTFPLDRVVSLASMEDGQQSEAEAQDGQQGHLSHSWVVAVVVSLVVILLAVAVTVFVVKLRQRRKRSAASRRRLNYSRTSDQLVAAPEQPVWRGPYTSRASYTRSPSPPSPAHLSEKNKWAQAQR